jgi:hypothetical protein
MLLCECPVELMAFGVFTNSTVNVGVSIHIEDSNLLLQILAVNINGCSKYNHIVALCI